MIVRVWQWSEYYCKINPDTAVNKYDIFLCTNSNYKKKNTDIFHNYWTEKSQGG